MNDPWTSFPDVSSIQAEHTGPFPHRPFLAAAERAVGTPPDHIAVHTDGDATVAVVLDDGTVRFAGPENLTDYHVPLGAEPAAVVAEALSAHRGRPFRLDSLPIEALEGVVSAAESVGARHEVRRHEAAAVLALPQSFDEWLMAIGKKERHEVRRKRRRFEAEFGAMSLERAGAEAIDEFCTMHRSSGGAKGAFMTEHMQGFFLDLLLTADACIHHLVCDGHVRASAFGFETPDGYYYYNSAYDPDAAMASPGVVLFSAMIERQIDRGAAVFDFLKGDERYKYRHGAEPRDLYVVEGSVS